MVPQMKTGRPSNAPRTPFGKRLLAAREKAGLSQAEVAKHFKVTQTTYADWERHPVKILPSDIEKLAKILNVSVISFFSEGDKKTKK